jgi:hypothetical protein
MFDVHCVANIALGTSLSRRTGSTPAATSHKTSVICLSEHQLSNLRGYYAQFLNLFCDYDYDCDCDYGCDCGVILIVTLAR